VSSLLTFSDPDNTYTPTDTFAGIAIGGDSSTSTQGAWQYSTDGSTWFAVGSVSTSSALLLSSTAKLRFVPSTDWNGTPGSLSVFAVDSTYETFTSGATRQTFNTTTDDVTSAVSAAAVTLGTSVTSVNDAPVFTSSAVTLNIADTDATDALTALTGTIAATDSHASAPGEGSTVAYSIAGGTSSGGYSSKVTTYGTLSLNTSTGAYTFTPNSAAINPLTVSPAATTFTINASDGSAATTQTFTVNVTAANDRPTLSADVVLSPIAEDSIGSVGQTVSGLLAPRFADIDTSSSLGGMVIVGNDATASQGEWQYKVSGGTWHAISTGVSTSSGLALSSTTSIRFVPALNFYGTPDLLIRAADNGYSGYSTDSTPATTAVTASGISATDKTISITVSPVNDAPVFAGVDLTGAKSDTSAPDTASSVGTITGSALTATDVDDATGLVFSLRGGSLSGGIWTMQGLYGVLSLAADHTWSYTPNRLDAINALPQGSTVHDIFDFKVADNDGAFSLKGLNISITGTNDVPILASSIADQSFTGSGSWSYQIPAATFTDAEGTGLTYTVEVVNAAGALVDDGTLASNAAWLSFSESTRTFSGNPQANSADIYVKVTATDDHSVTVSDIFFLDLTTTNDLPTGSVTIAVNNGRNTTNLQQGDVLTATSTLADGDVLGTISYQWYANGVVIADANTATLTLAQAQVGTAITVIASYTDAGGTAESVASVHTSHVVNVNDIPTSSADSITTLEDTTYVLTMADFDTFADADGTTLAAVQISTLPSNGTLRYNNADVITVATVANVTKAQIEAGLLTFTPTSNVNGADHIDFKVGDGTAFSASDYVLTLNVTAVNDAPTANAAFTQTVAYNEDPGASVGLGDIIVTDVDGDNVTAVLTLNTPAAGALTISDAATYISATGIWSVTGTVDAVNTALAAVTFTPATNWETDVTITTLIRDASGTGPAPGTITLDVTAVNDAPTSTIDSIAATVTVNSVTVSSDKVLTLTDFGTFADLDTGAAQTPAFIKITQLESVGSLKYTTDGTTWLDVTLNQEISAAEITAGHLKYVPPTVTGAQVATAVDAAFGAGGGTLYNADVKAGFSDTVVLTAKADGALADIASGTFSGGSYTATVTHQGAAAVASTAVFDVANPALPANFSMSVTGLNPISLGSFGGNATGADLATDLNLYFESDLTGNASSLLATFANGQLTVAERAGRAITSASLTSAGSSLVPSTVVFDVSNADAISARSIQLVVSGLDNDGSPGDDIIYTGLASTSGADLAADINFYFTDLLPGYGSLHASYADNKLTITESAGRAITSASLKNSGTEIDSTMVVNDMMGWQTVTIDVTNAQALTAKTFSIVIDGSTYSISNLNSPATVEILAGLINAAIPYSVDVSSNATSITISGNYNIGVPSLKNNVPAEIDSSITIANGHAAVAPVPIDSSITVTNGTAAQTEVVELAFTGSYSGASVTVDGVTATAGTAGGAGYDSIKFQVGDGFSAFSTNSYLLSVDGPGTTATLAANSLTTEAANTWANAYSGTPLTGFSDIVRVVVNATAGNIRLNAASNDSVITNLNPIPTGYGDLLNGTATSIAFEGTLTEVNAALALLQVNRGTNVEATISVSAIKGGAAYNPSNGHYYEVITGSEFITWTDAAAAAAGRSFNGLTGYLATITTADENAFIKGKISADGWIGANDATTEGDWKWVTGPEAGTSFWSGAVAGTPVGGAYSNWAPVTQPDNFGSAPGEDYGEFFTSTGAWNDLPNAGNITTYIVEYGAPGAVATEQVSRTFTVTAPVVAVNHAPTATNLDQALATYTEGDASVALTNIVVADVDGDSVTATLILNAPAAGGLTVGTFGDGTTVTSSFTAATGIWTVTGSVANVNLALADVSFTPATNNSANTTITTLIRDASGAGPAPGTITLNVTPANDIPTASDDSITMLEDTTYVLTLADFGTFADADGTTLAKVKITTLESVGSLLYNSTGSTWVDVTLDQEIIVADIVAGKLKYLPVAEANGSQYATIGFTVGDGTAFSTAPYVLTLNVTAVNDAPTGAATYTMPVGTEDVAYTVTTAQLLVGFADAADNETASLSVVNMSANHGTVSFSGGTYTITPTAGANYNDSVVLTYDVVDGHGSSVAGTRTFTQTAVNDPIVLTTPISDQTALTGTALNISIGTPFTDPESSAITYSATVNGHALSLSGLAINATTGTITGNPTGDAAHLDFVVTGTETTGGSTATSSFTVDLSDTATARGTVVNSLYGLSANNPGGVTITGTATQGQVLTAAVPTDTDGPSPVTGAVYQWQYSSTSAAGGTWTDVAGSRGLASTLTLAQTEVGQYVRVQAFYTDAGGVAEAPVSNVSAAVADANDPGTVVASGTPVPGYALSAIITDADGTSNAAPTYQWQYSSNGTSWTNLGGATSSSYVVTNAEGGKYLRVVTSYVDDAAHTETSITSPATALVQLGSIPPVAVDDSAAAVTEDSGLGNAVHNANRIGSGNVLTNDTDANSGDTKVVSGLRLGFFEGSGTAADGTDPDPANAVTATHLILVGTYGTLEMIKTTGAYTYTVAQDNATVQALNSGESITEEFNYTVMDSTDFTDIGVLTVTINGANDLPTMSGAAATATVVEDVATAVPLDLTFVDPDSSSLAITLTVTYGSLAATSADGVTVTNSGSAAVTISAASPALLHAWLADNPVYYLTASNANGAVATLSYQLNDGTGNIAGTGSTAITATAVNDAPVLTGLTSTAATITEDASTNSGQTVASMLGTLTDADTGTHASDNGTRTGMAVYAAISGAAVSGTWEYTLDAGANWTKIDPTTGTALLLRSTDEVRFVPDSIGGTTANDLTKPTLSYYAWDQSTGTAGSEVDFATRGGTTSLSSAGGVVSIAITDVNDAPNILVPGAQTVAEDVPLVITGISLGDPDISARTDGTDANDGVTATLAVDHGIISLAGTTGVTVTPGANHTGAMTLTGTLSAINTAVATLTYDPTPNYNGSDTLRSCKIIT